MILIIKSPLTDKLCYYKHGYTIIPHEFSEVECNEMLAELATISSIGKENSREGAWMCSDGPISGKVIICHTHILSGENAQAIYQSSNKSTES